MLLKYERKPNHNLLSVSSLASKQSHTEERIRGYFVQKEMRKDRFVGVSQISGSICGLHSWKKRSVWYYACYVVAGKGVNVNKRTVTMYFTAGHRG